MSLRTIQIPEGRRLYPIVLEQEKAARIQAFTHETAWDLGVRAVSLAKNIYRRSIAVHVFWDGYIIFSYSMDGCDAQNERWISGKQNAAAAAQCSSLLAALRYSAAELPHCAWEQDVDYLLCGGSFPLRLTSGECRGFVTVSGMSHEQDHQLAADAVAGVFHLDAPSILR
ncbi:MAG: heme-binding protein [Oscillospiraceae bacterium]|nr:heme-binding protein [Oscillospiraceae bacterium]